MEQLLSFQDRLGHRIAAVLATPDRPTDRVALLCHGFLSHKNSSSNLALTQRLTSRGVATFRFDCFGHGDSEGPFAKLTTTTGVGQTGSALDYLVNRGYGGWPSSAPVSAAFYRFSRPPNG